MNHKISCLIVCLAFLGTSDRATSQTYIIPEVGLNIHTIKFEGIPEYKNLNGFGPFYKSTDYNFDYGAGVKIKHQFSPKLSLNLNGNFYLRKHSYILGFQGDFSTIMEYVDYRMANLETFFSFEIIENFELGAGYKKLFIYNRSISLDMGNPESEPNVNINSYLLCLGYNYKNFVIDLSYSNSIKKSDNIGIEIFSFNVGYRIKLFDSFKRGQKVNCPKF